VENWSSQLSPLTVSLCLAIALVVAWSAGVWLAPAKPSLSGMASRSRFNDGAMALLGLLLAFTFGMSIARNDQRRVAVVQEADALGNLYACSGLLNEPLRNQLQTVIRDYTRMLVVASQGAFDPVTIARVMAAGDRMQDQMTQLVTQAVRDGTPATVPLLTALNQVASAGNERIAAFHDRLPLPILALLFFSAIAATLLIGREHNDPASIDFAGMVLFILMVSMAVFVTVDLNRPLTGLSRVSQAPLEHLLATISR
jgi:hypothetical protein